MEEKRFKIICKIDGEEFEGDFKGHEKKKLHFYLKKKYGMSYQDYVLKFDYNGVIPKCACGCGNETSYYKGVYRKYFRDHKNSLPPSQRAIELSKKSLKKINAIENRLKKLGISAEKMRELYVDYIDFKISSNDIHNMTAIDFRTVKKAWIDLGLITNKEVFRRVTKKHQYFWANKNDKLGGKKHIEEEVLLNIFMLLQKNEGNITIKEIIRKMDLPFTELVVFKRLKENFGEERVLRLIKSGLSSKPEIEFFNVLKFFYGNKIKKQFKLEGKFFDFKLGDKILIEYDGDYWHALDRHKQNDKEKNRIAEKNGFILIRIKDSEAKNFVILRQIDETFKKHEKV